MAVFNAATNLLGLWWGRTANGGVTDLTVEPVFEGPTRGTFASPLNAAMKAAYKIVAEVEANVAGNNSYFTSYMRQCYGTVLYVANAEQNQDEALLEAATARFATNTHFPTYFPDNLHIVPTISATGSQYALTAVSRFEPASFMKNIAPFCAIAGLDPTLFAGALGLIGYSKRATLQVIAPNHHGTNAAVPYIGAANVRLAAYSKAWRECTGTNVISPPSGYIAVSGSSSRRGGVRRRKRRRYR